jgi:hypothetical protein
LQQVRDGVRLISVQIHIQHHGVEPLAIGPLIDLLGTIIGITESFNVLSAAGPNPTFAIRTSTRLFFTVF